MSPPVLLQPAYVLHRRPYRETSFLLDLFTPDHGRLSAIIKGARQAKSGAQGLLQPFTPLLVSWTGRAEIMTLTHSELNGETQSLYGECLFAGFYLNELLVALLEKWDAHPGLFAAYQQALAQLQGKTLDQRALRTFEKRLIEELGYGILPKSNVSRHNIESGQFYRFIPEQGFVSVSGGGGAGAFSGRSLLAIAEESWLDEEVIRDAKRLTRMILGPLLGMRQLNSRKLFIEE
jgi:DNA repair protein RecO (recombination protein O)